MNKYHRVLSDEKSGCQSEDKIRRAAHDLNYHQEKIAEVFRSLSGASNHSPVAGLPTNDNDIVVSNAIRQVLQIRDRRRALFDEDLFADPAWDMLLELFLATIQQRRMSVSDVCNAARVPFTTALRWVKTLEQRGLIGREADFKDMRRIYVCLSAKGTRLMRELTGSLALVMR